MDLYKKFGSVIFKAKILDSKETIDKLSKGEEK
jgi:hypothetical protein